MKNYPSHIEEKAKAALLKGAKMTFEAICEMFMKEEAKRSKKKFKAANNDVCAHANPTVWLAEKNRENAMKNLPSSLRY